MAPRPVLLVLALTVAPRVGWAQHRPVVFEPNVGQAEAQVRFFSRGATDVTYLSERGLCLVVPGEHARAAVFRLDLGGAAPTAFEGQSALPGRLNYLVGPRETWKTDIPTYRAVRAREIHPGIDVVYAVDDKTGNLSFQFELAAGARAEQLILRMPSSDHIALEGHDTFVARSASMQVRISGLFTYQLDSHGARREVPSRFVRTQDGVRIEVGAYDRTRPLVIDPALSYGTYAGGRGVDTIYDVDVDAQGRAVMVGRSLAVSTMPYPTTPGAFQTMPSGTSSHGVVTKVDPAQTGAASLVFSTFVSGTGVSEIVSVDLDATGRAYIAGVPGAGFPTTANAYQTSCGAGLATSQTFAAILNATGTALDYATCVSSRDVRVSAVATHTSGDILIAGRIAATESIPLVNSYPLVGARSWVMYLMRINPTLPAANQIVYSTKMGGTGADEAVGVATNAAGEVFMHGLLSNGTPTTTGAHQTANQSTGLSFWVGKMDTAASGTASLIWGTFAGGTATMTYGARVGGVAADDTGAVYVAGSASGFPTTPGVAVPNAAGRRHIAFKVAPNGAALEWATYLDITGQGSPYDVTVGPGNTPYVVGRGNSQQNSTCAATTSNSSAYLVRLAANATAFEYVTPVPGTDVFAYGVSVDTSSTAYVAGGSGFNGNVTTQGGFQLARADSQDGFLSVLPSSGSCDELAITKVTSLSTLSLGDQAIFTLTVDNLGESPQRDVRVTDALPSGLTLVSATPSQGSCNTANPVVCDLGIILPTQSATIMVRATAASAGRIVNTAQVTSTSGDGDPSNNQDSAAIDVTTPCGALTLLGECAGTRLRFCEDAGTLSERIVEVDCATEAFPDVRGVCTEISASYGFDCAVPDNLTCGFVDGFGDPIYGLCDGTNPGCVVDPAMDAALCRSGVGPCAEAGFAETCAGDVLLVECQVNQPVGFDCAAAGGLCRNARCEGLNEGARCNGADLRCDPTFTCHTNERCEDPANICDPDDVLPTCTGPQLTFCDPRTDLVETFSCRDRVVGAAATCGAPFTCLDDGSSRACSRVTVSCVAQGEGATCDPSRDVYCGVGLSCVVERENGEAVQRCRQLSTTCTLEDLHAGCSGDVATACLGFAGLVAAEPTGWDCGTFGSACATRTATTAPECAGRQDAPCDDPALFPTSPFTCAEGFVCVGATQESFGRCAVDTSRPDAGVDGGVDAGADDGGATRPDAGQAGDGGVRRDAAVRPDAGTRPTGEDEGGCTCIGRAAYNRRSVGLGVLGLLVVLGRRRRRGAVPG